MVCAGVQLDIVSIGKMYRGHSSAENTACSMMLTIHGVLLDIILLGGVQAQRLNYNTI